MKTKIYYGWWVVLASFFLGLYVAGVIFFGFTAFIDPIRKEFEWSYTQISLAASLRGLEMGIFAPVVGFLADRLGSRKLILFGALTAGFAFILLSLTRSLFMFYAAFLLIAFGAGGCTSVVTMTAVASWFQRRVGLAFGLMASGFGAGGLIVPLIVWLIDAYGWRPTVVILGLGMWALGIPVSLIIRNKPRRSAESPDEACISASTCKMELQSHAREIDFIDALKMRAFLYLNLSETLRFMTIAAVATHVMPYLSSIGFPRAKAGLVAAGIPLFSIIGRLGFGLLGDLFEKRYVMGASFCFMAMGLIAFNHIQEAWAVLLFLLLFSPGYGGAMVMRGVILREYFGGKSFGKLLGIIMGSASIGGIVGPTLAGWAYDSLGSYHGIWLVFFGISIVAIGLIMRVKPS